MKTVKNKTNKALVIPNYGKRAPNETWQLPDDVAAGYLQQEGFELVKDKKHGTTRAASEERND